MVDPKLVRAFYRSHLFLKNKVETEGWIYSANYLREHARCAFGVQFTNSQSPLIMRALRMAHPETAKWLDLKPLKQPRPPTLFSDEPLRKRPRN